MIKVQVVNQSGAGYTRISLTSILLKVLLRDLNCLSVAMVDEQRGYLQITERWHRIFTFSNWCTADWTETTHPSQTTQSVAHSLVIVSARRAVII